MLVMDLMMPRINGFEATKRIKQIRTYSESSGRDLFSFRPRDLPADVPQRSGRASAQAGVATSLVPTIRSLYETDTSADSLLA
jgi:CheY-like chemotaxis protein